MKRWLILLALLSPSVARANQITPAFTQGSMNATTTTVQTVTETVEQKVYGGELNSWTGTNVTATSLFKHCVKVFKPIFMQLAKRIQKKLNGNTTKEEPSG